MKANVILVFMILFTGYLPAQTQLHGNHVPVTTASLGRAEVTEEEWSAFLRENLERDLAPWRTLAPLQTNKTFELYESLMKQLYLPAVFKIVLIYNNRIYWPHRPDPEGTDPPHPASPLKETFQRRIGSLLASGRLQLPNVLFLFSSEDNRGRWCGPTKICSIPLISLFKTIDKDGEDTDILIPQFLFTPNSVYYYPWHLKKDLAYFRGVPFCSNLHRPAFPKPCDFACPRTYLAWRSLEDRRTGRQPAMLDVGLVEVNHVEQEEIDSGVQMCVSERMPVVPRSDIADHTRYKWLLHLEGISASSRLAQLFLTNSVVLVQQQPFIEYFSRSLRPGVHYVPFWNDSTAAGLHDVYDVVSALRERDARDPSYVQRITHEAQTFAMKFSTPPARARYLKDALERYKSLFPDMDTFLEGYVEELRQKGFPIPRAGEAGPGAQQSQTTHGGRSVRQVAGFGELHRRSVRGSLAVLEGEERDSTD